MTYMKIKPSEKHYNHSAPPLTTRPSLSYLPARSTNVNAERVWAAGWVTSKVSRAWDLDEWAWEAVGATLRLARPRSSNAHASLVSVMGWRVTPVKEGGMNDLNAHKIDRYLT